MKLCCRSLVLVFWSGLVVLGCGPTQDPLPPRGSVSLAVLDDALSERDELERMYQLTRFLRTLAPEDVPAALEAVEKHRVGVTKEEVQLFMLGWTRVDAPGAFEAARNWPTPWKSVLMEKAMYAWGFNDGKAALAACEQVEDTELRDRLTTSLVQGWVRSHDHVGVSEYIASLPAMRRRDRLSFRLAGELMRDGPDAVIAWAEAVPVDAPNQFKQYAFYHAAGSVTRVDPARVIPFYKRHMGRGYTSTALRNIAIKWSQYHDPRELVAWVLSLPAGTVSESMRAEAIGAAVRTWAEKASDEVGPWLERKLPDPSFDRAIAEFVRAIADTSPELAVSWAARIENEAERRKYTLRAGRRWMKQAPEAARAWAVGADMPEDWREQILATKPRRKRDPNAQGGKRRPGPKRMPGRG
ncbi:MAG: hypothetical protein VX466_12515 [Myxococcota bacterium]|nr:hypothetical protein [Myxococcota bacterium]